MPNAEIESVSRRCSPLRSGARRRASHLLRHLPHMHSLSHPRGHAEHGSAHETAACTFDVLTLCFDTQANDNGGVSLLLEVRATKCANAVHCSVAAPDRCPVMLFTRY